jgi:UDP-glucose 4-epimerase
MKVVVCGGAGFIGSHLCEYLLDQGHEVLAADNLSRGSVDNLETIIKKEKFKFVEVDVSDVESLSNASVGADIMYHLADESDIQFAADHPESYFIDNAAGLFGVVQACKKNKISTLVFSSSTTVFGNHAVPPVRENFGPLRPESLYGASKASAEIFLNAWSLLERDLKIVAFRFASVVGGRQDHGVIHDFVQKLARDNKKLNVLGNGEQKRAYLLVDDCVRIISDYSESLKDPGFRVVHLGNRDVMRVRDVAQIVCDEFNVDYSVIRY